MSLTLNMVGGGSGGGLSATDALLRVQAPIGSAISITKGAVTKTDVGHENADDNRFYDYYFIIHASQFDSITPWTVTMVNGSMTQTDTVIINSANEYDVLFKYLLLYDYGNEFTDITGGWLFSQNSYPSASLTKNDDNMVLYVSRSGGQNAASGCTYTANAIDYTIFSTVKYLYDLAITGSSNADQCSFVARTTAPTNGGYETSDPYTANLQAGTNKTGSCDISSATSPFYTAIRAWSITTKGTTVTATIKRIWLE